MPHRDLDRFRNALSSWQERLNADEWTFVRLRDDLIAHVDPPDAYRLIDEMVPVLLQQAEDFPRAECGAMSLALARAADTSEMPPLLARHWDQVLRALASDAQVQEELRRWYRRPAA